MTCPQVWKTGMFSDLTVKPTKHPIRPLPLLYCSNHSATCWNFNSVITLSGFGKTNTNVNPCSRWVSSPCRWHWETGRLADSSCLLGKVTGPCETNPPASKSDTQWYQTWAFVSSVWVWDTSLTAYGGKVTDPSKNRTEGAEMWFGMQQLLLQK